MHVGLNGSGQDIYTATFTPDVSNTEVGLGEGQCVQLHATYARERRRGEQHRLNFGGDTLAPTVSMRSQPPSTLLAGQTALVTFTFSEALASFALATTSPCMAGR